MGKITVLTFFFWAVLLQAAVAQSQPVGAGAPADLSGQQQVSAPAPGAETTMTAAAKNSANAEEKAPVNLLKTGASQNAFELGTQERMLAWEKWHARIGHALARRIGDANGSGLGTVILRITVSKDGVLKAEPIAGGARMSKIAVGAAESLSFDQLLKFPPESKREFMTFDFQFKRGLFILPKHHYIKDDYERMDEGSAQ